MPLVDTAHREIGERVLGVVIEAHDVGLVVDLGIETGHADVVAVAAELVVQVGGECLRGPEVRHQSVPCPRGDERLGESRGVGEVSHIGIHPVSSMYEICRPGLCRVCEELRDIGLALGSDGLPFTVVGGQDLAVIDDLVAVVVQPGEKALAYQTFPPE